MAKFTFTLEVVLNERKRIEDKKLRELMLAQNILQGMINQKEEYQRRVTRAISEATELAQLSQNSTAEVSVMDTFIIGMKIKIQQKTLEIERGKKLTEKKRLEYIVANQKRKVIEKLKDKRFAEYKAYMKKRELKELDDLYLMHGRWDREHL